MVDFTSALFLDHRHGSAVLPPWASLTSGRPAAVEENGTARRLAARLATAQRAEAGVVHRSALHALWDVVDLVTRRRRPVLVLDEGVYPLAWWAAAGAAMRGVPVITFRHRAAAGLGEVLQRTGRAPVVLTDGWCPDCSQPAPLGRLAKIAAAAGGQLVVDDTLAAGVLGAHPGGSPPFGSGGAGTFAWLGADRGQAVVVISLAKAYGAPLAVTTGPDALMRPLRQHGTRWHTSPPTAVDLHAADAATTDERANDRRRRHLAGLVTALRTGLRALGMPAIGRAFPMVSVPVPSWALASALHRRLSAGGVRSLLRQLRCQGDHALTFAVTAAHGPSDIEWVLGLLGGWARRPAVRAAT